MEYRRFGNTIVARIDQGEDVLEKMKRIECQRTWNFFIHDGRHL